MSYTIQTVWGCYWWWFDSVNRPRIRAPSPIPSFEPYLAPLTHNSGTIFILYYSQIFINNKMLPTSVGGSNSLSCMCLCALSIYNLIRKRTNLHLGASWQVDYNGPPKLLLRVALLETEHHTLETHILVHAHDDPVLLDLFLEPPNALRSHLLPRHPTLSK